MSETTSPRSDEGGPGRYRVILTAHASTVIEVEAGSADEAVDVAYEETPYICAACSGWGQSNGIEIGDWDLADPENDVERIS